MMWIDFYRSLVTINGKHHMVSSFTILSNLVSLWGRRREKASVWLPFSRKRINRRWDLASWPKSFTVRVAYHLAPKVAHLHSQGMQMNLALQPRPKKFRTLMGDASGGRWVEEIPKLVSWIHRKAQLFLSGTRQNHQPVSQDYPIHSSFRMLKILSAWFSKASDFTSWEKMIHPWPAMSSSLRRRVHRC